MALWGGLGCNAKGATKGIQRDYNGAYKGEVATGVKNLREFHFPGILGCHAAPWVVTMVGPKTTSNDPGTHF